MPWTEANGVSLRYDLSGEGRFLVLSNEMAGMIESWEGVVAALPPGFRVLRYDQRGFGLSEKRSDFTLDTHVTDLGALLDAVAPGVPAIVAGCAIGASVALALAAREPRRVAGLVLASPALGGMPVAARDAMRLRMAQVRELGVRAVTDAMFTNTYPEALTVEPGIMAAHKLRWLSAGRAPFVRINDMVAEYDLGPELERIECPVLILGSVHDRIRPLQACRAIADRIPGASFATIDAAHFASIQNPVAFAGAIAEFAGVVARQR